MLIESRKDYPGRKICLRNKILKEMDMHPISIVISFFITLLILELVRKGVYAKGKPNEKKSKYYNMTAEEIEEKYQHDKLIFVKIPLIAFAVLFFFIIVFSSTDLIANENSYIVFIIVLVLLIALMVMCFIGLTKISGSNAIIERDCDVIKGRKIAQMRAENKHYSKKTRATYMIEVAHTYAISDEDSWDYKTVEALKAADAFYSKAKTIPGHVNVRLKLAARNKNLHDISVCRRMLIADMGAFGGASSIYDGLVEEADIHKHMLLGEFAEAKKAITKHMKRGDCILAYVYLHYYLAIIALSENNYQEAAPHIDYVRNNGGTTYYMNDLAKRFNV